MFSLCTLPNSTIRDDTILIPAEVSVPGLPLREVAERVNIELLELVGGQLNLEG
jgi:hypothetical protein